MNTDIYHIPVNFTNAGRIMGLFEIRNLIEALILCLPVLYLCLSYLPLPLTPKLVITLSLVVPIGGFGLMGVGDDSLSRWVKGWYTWRCKRRRMAFRGEVVI